MARCLGRSGRGPARSRHPRSRATSCSSAPTTAPCAPSTRTVSRAAQGRRARVSRCGRTRPAVRCARRRASPTDFLYVGSDDGSAARVRHPAGRVLEEPARRCAGVTQPTVARFGPDHRLYVAQYNGLIKVLTIARTGVNAYSVTNTETITLVQSIPNHDDDGALDPSVTTALDHRARGRRYRLGAGAVRRLERSSRRRRQRRAP